MSLCSRNTNNILREKDEEMRDLISRQLLISKLANSTVKFANYDEWEHCCDVIESVEREKGEWIIQDGIVCCSECGEPNMEWNYCPNCGADMRRNNDE